MGHTDHVILGRRLARAALVAAVMLPLAGCATGFSAQTSKQYQAGVGADHRTGDVEVLGALLVANADGSATLSARLLNRTPGARVLTGVGVTDDAGRALTLRSTPFLLSLPAQELATVGVSSDAGGYVVEQGAAPGRYVHVVWSFDHGVDVDQDVPVVARSAAYDEVPTGITGS